MSYALIGILALQIPLGQGGQAADRQGVLRQLATESWGKAALVGLAIGFAGYALWRFAEAVFDRGDEGTDAKGLAKRARSFGIGVLYAVSAAAAYPLDLLDVVGRRRRQRAAGDRPGASSGRRVGGSCSWSRPGSSPTGLYNVYRGVTKKFRERLAEHEMHGKVRTWALRSGVLGHVARGVVFVVVGIFLGKAALEYDPQEAIGIDGALLKLVEAPFGPLLLGLVAAGLVSYAVYCLVEARYREI